jgi:nucleoside-diphosphate-sugar epimerase
MRVLLTGGDGFVGRTLCRLLVRDHEVSVLDSFRFGASRSNYLPSIGAKLYVADIRDRSKVEQIISKVSPEVVFHLAALFLPPQVRYMRRIHRRIARILAISGRAMCTASVNYTVNTCLNISQTKTASSAV